MSPCLQSTQDRQRYLAAQISNFGASITEGYRAEFIKNQRFIETALVQLRVII